MLLNMYSFGFFVFQSLKNKQSEHIFSTKSFGPTPPWKALNWHAWC